MFPTEPVFRYSADKNAKLLRERGVCFEDAIALLDAGEILAILPRPNQNRHPGQCTYILEINGYAWVVPFERKGNEIWLRTIYPGRKAARSFCLTGAT